MNTLYTYPKAPRALKGIIAAKYSNTPLHVTNANEFKMGVTNKSEEFLAKFPLGKVPALETEEGECITESVAIAYYLSNDALRGLTSLDSAHIMKWVLFSENELVPHLMTWVLPCMGLLPFNKKETEKAKAEVARLLGVVEKYLNSRTYFVGHSVTLADICMMCNLLVPFTMVFDPEYRAPFVNIYRWFDTMINQPNIRPIVGDIDLCVEMAQFDAKRFKELHPLEKKKKEEKPKESPKKAEKPKPPPEDDDPVKSFPVGTKFDLEQFKREYLNSIIVHEKLEDKVAAFCVYLEDHFDAENYSIYQCHHSFPEELARENYKVLNLVTSGFYQMTKSLLKYYFGIVQVYHTPESAQIHGLFFFRGGDVIFSHYPQFEYFASELYTWKRLDLGGVKDVVEKFLENKVEDHIPFLKEIRFV